MSGVVESERREFGFTNCRGEEPSDKVPMAQRSARRPLEDEGVRLRSAVRYVVG